MARSKFEFVSTPNYLFLTGLRIWAGVTAYFFFRKLKVAGRENIPKDRPVVFAVNHQSAFLDPVLIGITCGRKPWYLTRAGVFKKGLVSFILRAIHMLPVYRPRDKVNLKDSNETTFEECMQILEGQGSVLIFPEGNHGMQKRLRTPLKKGIARIVLDAEKRNFFRLGVVIVPVGINYEHPTKFRTDVLINYGKGFDTSDLKEIYVNSETEGINVFIRRIETEMRARMVDISSKQDYDTIEKQWLSVRSRPSDLSARLSSDQDIIRNILEGRIPEKSKDPHRSPFKEILKIVLFPVFLAGFLLNLPVFLFTKILLRQTVIDPHFRQSIMFVTGMLAVPLFTVVEALLISMAFPLTGIFWFSVVLIPLSGLVSYDYYDLLVRGNGIYSTRKLAKGFLPEP